ncbi:MAG: SH3 domain-containing protein [Bacteroidales bacterium]|nr:SH3 domain-containing protein [Bacteroidales bacterium]
MVLRINIILVFLLLALTSFGAPSTTQDEARYAGGVQSYTEGDYEQALEAWLELYDAGYRSAELAYNIGNAHYKTDNIPGAILFYERARLLKPADEDINYNLMIARTRVVDRFEEIPELFFIKWFNFVSLSVSSNGWAKFSLASFILFLLLLSLYIYSSKYRLKVMGFWTALFFLIFSLSTFAFSNRNKFLVYEGNKAIIFSPAVSGKSSPDNSGTDLFMIHEGTRVTVEDAVGEWYEIRLSDGNKGWVPANTLEII